MSRLANSSEGILFGQFLDFLRFYENFEVRFRLEGEISKRTHVDRSTTSRVTR